ncbi:DedA family protein [Lentilactobacillus senioris]|uniref:DedA family protein n=1 Tax=Lentilactobacillus senioris TaxID=931534 RepID=UPI002280A4FE|nr:DedA family protein [Lentilactobacillus senioris]MCY9806396.1 DedA family protein [Lentilactobacillus senioris]
MNPESIYVTFKNISTLLDSSIKAAITVGGWHSYTVFFLIIFLGCAFIFLAWLPSDVLIFLCGTMASTGRLNIFLVIIVGSLAAFSGNQLKYFLASHDKRAAKKMNNSKTENYFNRDQKEAVISGNLIPAVGNLIPMLAGYNKMNYHEFTKDNAKGAFLWLTLFALLGFASTAIPIVAHNMVLSSLVISLAVGLLYRFAVQIITSHKNN